MSRAALALALIATVIAVFATVRAGQQPSTGAGLVQAAKQYLSDIAKQNSLKIDGEKIVAVRQTGNEGIVRVIVRYHQYLQLCPSCKTLKGPEQETTLAVHLHRSQWNAGYANG